MHTIKDSPHCNELKQLGFPEERCASLEMCENLLTHCKLYHMKFFKGSYGTLVHEKFSKIFRKSSNHDKQDELLQNLGGDYTHFVDHVNLFKVNKKDIYILTLSPYCIINLTSLSVIISSYPYNICAINPRLLEYAGHVEHGRALRNPLVDMNYMCTDANLDEIDELNDLIFKELGIDSAFRHFIY